MEIRQMMPQDMDRITAITEVAWNDNTLYKLMEDRHGIIGNTGWRQRKVNEVRSFCLEHPENVIVAVVDGKVVGYASFAINLQDKRGDVSNNAVDPQYQRRGVATAMIGWIMGYFRTAGLRIAAVGTLAHDVAAQCVYEKHGFKELARSIYYSTQLPADSGA